HPIYSTQEQLGFLHLKKVIGQHVLHIPHYNIPVLAKFNLVTTIHDLTHIVYPQGASKKFASVYMKFMIERVIKTAKRVICDSRSTECSLRKIYKIENMNIDVIHIGIDKKFCRIEDNKYLQGIKEKYKLPDKFILYVGSIRRHKNIKMLLESFSELRKRIPDVWLVVVGRLNHHFDFTQKNILYIGEIPDDRELAAIYNMSSVFCNLSLHEGFGLTILEAQQCGLGVVCSNIDPHLEIGGDSICAVPPDSISQIANALHNVLTDDALRESLIQKGLKNISRFDWKITADKTIAIYEELLGSKF
ncbi:MAG: glycosyltransferase family 1 protein, partial [Candidatus Omnitrophota bacterium]